MQSRAILAIRDGLNKLKGVEINNFPIRYKIIVLLLLISIVPSICLGFLINVTVDKIIDKQVTENTLQLIGQANKSLEANVENMQNISYLLSFDPAITSFLQHDSSVPYDEYQIKKFLQGFTTVNPEIAGILVINSEGEYISNEMYARSIKPLTEESWYSEAVKNKGIFKIVGHPTERNVTSHVNYKANEIVSGVRSILDPDTQKVIGVILIDLKLRVISEIIEDVRPGKSGLLMVIDDEGEAIYFPSNPLIDGINKNWFDESHSGAFSREANGKSLQFIYRTSSFTNWTTIGVFPTSQSALEVQQIHFYVISFLFVVCLFGIGASYNLANSMSRPIGQLIAFMNKAEAGDLSIRYKGDRRDEIGILGRSFNKMLVQINRLLSLTELQERQKREAELKALQAHIKPHFLYNTLDTINWMARKKDAIDVAELVDSLSQLFRIGLNRGNDIISLENEMEHINSYLKIQKARYKEKLNYHISVSPDLQEVSVLKLVLQPIVENAIYHGIKERRGPGQILIEAKEQEGNLLLRVKDDGKGMPEEKVHLLTEILNSPFSKVNPSKESIGYGIRNVQERIKLTFGEKYGLSIESEVEKGTTVTVQLPISS